MNKKVIAIVAACALCLGLLAACAGQTKSAPSASSAASASSAQAASQATSATAGKIKVVCATFPAYDWVRQVVGDRAGDFEITYLMGSGVDLHSYQPTVADIAKISDAGLFVYVGGESDKWATDAVAAAANANLRTVNMLGRRSPGTLWSRAARATSGGWRPLAAGRDVGNLATSGLAGEAVPKTDLWTNLAPSMSAMLKETPGHTI